MIDWETSLLLHVKKNLHFCVNFFSMSLFLMLFSTVNEKKIIYFIKFSQNHQIHQRALAKGTLLLHKNITCIN